VRWFDVRVSSLPGRRGKVLGRMYVFRDITGRKNLEEELTQFATTDTLTGSFNRRMGFAVLDKQIKLVRRMKAPLSVCYVDIDSLKAVNDRFGHIEGDRYITSVSRVIRDSIGELDSLCRLGGDEFLVILPQCTADQARLVWSRILRRFEEINENSGGPYRVGASCGISEVLQGEHITADELVARADSEMYLEKKSRKP